MDLKAKNLFLKRQKRTRFKLRNSRSQKLRLTVFRSNLNTYAQIIDDSKGVTLVYASTLEKDIKASLKNAANVDAATLIGETIAKRAVASDIKSVVFDRGGYKYHGRVKALCEAARSAGLEI